MRHGEFLSHGDVVERMLDSCHPELEGTEWVVMKASPRGMLVLADSDGCQEVFQRMEFRDNSDGTWTASCGDMRVGHTMTLRMVHGPGASRPGQ